MNNKEYLISVVAFFRENKNLLRVHLRLQGMLIQKNESFIDFIRIYLVF